MTRLIEAASGSGVAAHMLSGRGIGLILKSITVNFRRPVVYPDTVCLLWYYAQHLTTCYT